MERTSEKDNLINDQKMKLEQIIQNANDQKEAKIF